MRKITNIIFGLVGMGLLCGCQEELRSKDDIVLTEKEVRLVPTGYEAVLTRSSDMQSESKRMFLGMAGRDSLFMTASETPAATAPFQMTKSGGSEIPGHFNVAAFRDDEPSPYVDLKVTSYDSWSTYSPMLYWPDQYEGIHFFAYTYNIGDNHISPTLSTSRGFTAEFDYEIPYSTTSDDDAEVQPDILFAISPSQRESEEAVEMNFFHVLSAIEFKTGEIGDATAAGTTGISITEISGIRSKGHCTITHPVSADNVIWTTTDDLSSYTQTIKEGVSYMIIPQKLTDTDASFTISIQIGDIVHEFPAKRLSEITDEWKPNRKYTYTISKGGEVKVDVRDDHTDIVKDNVKIQNTGFTTSYIRAAIVGYWAVEKDGVEEIASEWDINDAEVGTLTKASDWDNHWEFKDGIYYHKSPVAPGAYTAPLFDRYELKKATGPVSGSRLSINIAVQAIEATEKATEYWPVN